MTFCTILQVVTLSNLITAQKLERTVSLVQNIGKITLTTEISELHANLIISTISDYENVTVSLSDSKSLLLTFLTTILFKNPTKEILPVLYQVTALRSSLEDISSSVTLIQEYRSSDFELHTLNQCSGFMVNNISGTVIDISESIKGL